MLVSYKNFHAVGYVSEGGVNKPKAKLDVILYLFVLQPWLYKKAGGSERFLWRNTGQTRIHHVV